MAVTPSVNARYFTSLYGNQNGGPSFGYLWDSSVEWLDTNGNLNTGAMRPATPADFAANISVSGLNLTVGAVAITGQAVVTTTGNTPVSIVNTAPLAFSGVTQANVTNVLLATSGVATVLSLPTHNVAVTGGSIQTIVTGSVSASFDSVPIVNAQITGNNYLADISGRLNNTLGAPINVSGVVSTTVSVGNVAVTGGSIQTITTGSFSATVDNTMVILAIASGNNLLTTANILASGVSGLLTSNLTDPAYVTGQVGITTTLLATSGNSTIVNTAPIPVSGVTQANVTNAVLAVSGNTITQITGWNTGLVVTTDVRSSSTAGNSTPSGVAPFNGAGFFWGQALAANANRSELFVQNIHTGTPLYLNLGSVAASTGAFSMILNPSTQLNWGGTSWGSRSWRGGVQVSGAAWIAWEI